MTAPRAGSWKKPGSATSCGRMGAEHVDAFTDDAALGGRLTLRQPARGHRFGHDAILLAAATPAAAGEGAVDLGAGGGAAGLALAWRVAGLAVRLVDRHPGLAGPPGRTARRDRSRRRG